VWPFLLDYPKRSIAIIDAVCALHPLGQDGKLSTYGFQNPFARCVERGADAFWSPALWC
jgi:hypothetical protein